MDFCIRLGKAVAIACAITVVIVIAAHAQSSGQTPGGANVPGHTQYCPNGIKNTDGSFQVVPCGGPGSPAMQVIVTNPNTAPAVVMTQPNPFVPVNPFGTVPFGR